MKMRKSLIVHIEDRFNKSLEFSLLRFTSEQEKRKLFIIESIIIIQCWLQFSFLLLLVP